MKKRNGMDESLIRDGLRGYKPKSERFDEIWENIRTNRSAYSAKGSRRHLEKIIVGYACAAAVFVLSITVGASLWSRLSDGNQPNPAGQTGESTPGGVHTTDPEGYVTKTIRGDKEGVETLDVHDPERYFRIHNDALDGQDGFAVYQRVGSSPAIRVVNGNKTYPLNYTQHADAEGESYTTTVTALEVLDAAVIVPEYGADEMLLLSTRTYREIEMRTIDGQVSSRSYEGTFFWVIDPQGNPRDIESNSMDTLAFGDFANGALAVCHANLVRSTIGEAVEKGSYETVLNVVKTKCGDLLYGGDRFRYVPLENPDPDVTESTIWGDREGVDEFVKLLNAGGAWEYDPMNCLTSLRDKLDYRYNASYSAENILRIHTADLDGQDEFEVYQQYGDRPMAWVLYRGETVYPLMDWSPDDGMPSIGQVFRCYTAEIPLIIYDIILVDPRGDGSRDLMVMAYSKRTAYNVDWHADDTKEYSYEDLNELVCAYQFSPDLTGHRVIRTIVSDYNRDTNTFDTPYCGFSRRADSERIIDVMYARLEFPITGVFAYDYSFDGRYGYLEYHEGGEWRSDYWEFVKDSTPPESEPAVPEPIPSDQPTWAEIAALHEQYPDEYRDPGEWQPETEEMIMLEDGQWYQSYVSASSNCRYIFVSDREVEMSATWDFLPIGSAENAFLYNLGVIYDDPSGAAKYVERPIAVRGTLTKGPDGYAYQLALPDALIVCLPYASDETCILARTKTLAISEDSASLFANLQGEVVVTGIVAQDRNRVLYLRNVELFGAIVTDPVTDPTTGPAPNDPPDSPGDGKVTSVAPGPDKDSIIEDGFLYSLSEGGDFYYIVGIGSNMRSDLVVPGSYNGLPTAIYPDAFHGCEGLVTVTISEGVRNIGHRAFRNISSLTSVSIPSSVDTIGDGAFSGCANLESVTISQGVRKIGESAFEGVVRLQNITIPASVEIIAEYAFWGCERLESLTVLSNITLRIGSEAFGHCGSLISATLPKYMEYIGERAFADCPNLTDIYFGGSKAEWDRADGGIGIDERTTVHFGV